MAFSGFSEDDIRKLAKGQDMSKPQRGSQKTAFKKVSFKPNNITNSSKSKSTHNNTTSNNILAQDLPENATLSVSNKPSDRDDAYKSTQPLLENIEIKPIEQKQEKLLEIEPKNEKKFRDLDEFEARQKLIEEQNRKRKELLSKALADRTKRTQEEAQRLSEIQEEFKKLDAILSGDVKILRKQIELASIDYMECHKRYTKIEKEFLEAKVLLHQKQERKEMLTEHLCTIIEKNEERKAEKLTELLDKLQLTPEYNVKTESQLIADEVKS